MRGLCNAASEGVFFSERPPDFKTTPFRPTGDWEPGTDTKGAGYLSHVPSAPGYPVRARVAGRQPPPAAERGLSKPRCGLFDGISRRDLFPRAVPRSSIGPMVRACPLRIPGASGSPGYAGTPELHPPAHPKNGCLLFFCKYPTDPDDLPDSRKRTPTTPRTHLGHARQSSTSSTLSCLCVRSAADSALSVFSVF